MAAHGGGAWPGAGPWPSSMMIMCNNLPLLLTAEALLLVIQLRMASRNQNKKEEIKKESWPKLDCIIYMQNYCRINLSRFLMHCSGEVN